MRLQVLGEVNMKIAFFWDVMPYSLAYRYKHYRETYFFHLYITPPPEEKQKVQDRERKFYSYTGCHKVYLVKCGQLSV